MNPIPGAPSDNDTLRDVLAGLAADGWDGEVDAREGGQLAWRRCGHAADASDVRPVTVRRMEGASDPADMLAVLAVPCPACGDRGVIVVHYGPTAGPADADVLAALPMP